MKKTMRCLLLICTVLLCLCACGTPDNSTEPKDKTKPVTEANTTAETKEQTTEQPDELKLTPTEVAIGDTVSLPFVELTLDQLEISEGYQFEHTEKSSGISITHKCGIDCPSGMKLVSLRGAFTNKTKTNVYPNNHLVYCWIVINGNEYTTMTRGFNLADAQPVSSIAPQMKTDCFVTAEVPSNVAGAIKTCEVYFGFTEDLDPSAFISGKEDCTYLYILKDIPTKYTPGQTGGESGAGTGNTNTSGKTASKWGVIGSITEWGGKADIPMYEVSSGIFESDVLELHADDELKVRANNSWAENYGTDGPDGINLLVDAGGRYVVILDLNKETIWIEAR